MMTTFVERVGSIDNKPPERVPHEEYVGKNLAKARLLMPLRLKRLESLIEDLCGDVHELFCIFQETFQKPCRAISDNSTRTTG
jgi:hypothetical protein